MIEVEQLVKTYRVDAQCDCGGKMVYGGICLTSFPPQYPHKCETCGNVENLDHSYPCHRTKIEQSMASEIPEGKS